METKKTLLLVATPGNGKSTSLALGSWLARGLAARGGTVETRLLYPVFGEEERRRELLDLAMNVDLLLLAFPLYIDHLPAPLVLFLEELHTRRQEAAATPGAAVAAIVNCGFPETMQCQVAADIVRRFAETSGFRSLGCLIMGMGGFVSGRALDRTGRLMRGQRQALEEAAAALAEGKEIPAAVLERFGRPLMPRWLYTLFVNHHFKRTARRCGASAHLADRPFA